jgi:Cof subfamily protein (haloacid dehalogenase superfamily)
MKKHKILVLDIDGTLTNSNKEISSVNRDSLLKLQQTGVKVVLASGRPTFGIEPIAKEIELAQYGGFILSFNGGKIINYNTGEVVYELNLPNHLLPEIYTIAKEHHLAILSYDDKSIITESGDDHYVKKEAFLNKAPIQQVDSFLEAIPTKISKCLIVGHESEIAILEKKMQAYFGKHINVFRSEPFFLELVPKNIDKAASLERLVNHLGITKDEMIACGDGFNDLSMIQYAGLGVAMSNAQEIVKQSADYITLSNDEDGVAHIIEKYFF